MDNMLQTAPPGGINEAFGGQFSCWDHAGRVGGARAQNWGKSKGKDASLRRTVYFPIWTSRFIVNIFES